MDKSMSSTFPQAILYGYSHLLIQCPLVVLPHYKCEKHLEQKFAPVILTILTLAATKTFGIKINLDLSSKISTQQASHFVLE